MKIEWPAARRGLVKVDSRAGAPAAAYGPCHSQPAHSPIGCGLALVSGFLPPLALAAGLGLVAPGVLESVAAAGVDRGQGQVGAGAVQLFHGPGVAVAQARPVDGADAFAAQ